MKAVIMAGGEGTRLRPVSDRPKPLVNLLGRPVIEHIIFLLREHGIRDICVTLRYRPEEIKKTLGDGSGYGVNIRYHIENEPLGTAGGVRACADFYQGGDFLVISGDAACDFDLSRLMRFHRGLGADLSMALFSDPEPTGYGLVLTDRNKRVSGFIEKPSWERVVTNLVNTGIYAVSPRTMALVPENRAFDFARELFPLMLKRGMGLYGLPMEGYWCDIGTPKAYYRCNLDALEGRLRLLRPWDRFAPAPRREQPPSPRRPMVHSREYPCGDRAKLMRALSENLAEFGADFTDGILLAAKGGQVRISPSPEEPSILIEGDAEGDAEKYEKLARRLDLAQQKPPAKKRAESAAAVRDAAAAVKDAASAASAPAQPRFAASR